MFVIWALALYGVFCAFFVFVMLMGPSPTWRNTFIGSINRWLTACPQNTAYYLCLVRSGFNKERASERASDCYTYFADSPNPVIQIFYALLVGVSLYFFYTGVAETVPSFHLMILNIVVAISLAFYGLAWLSDPGVVENDIEEFEKNKLNFRYAYDGIHYQENGPDCRSCNVPKPARSKHCKICGHCVRRFDHHCPWINTDVGENNLKWFHAFLLSHVVMSALVGYWSGNVVYAHVQKEQTRLYNYALSRGIKDQQTIESMLPAWYIFVLYSAQQNPTPGVLAIFAGLIAILLLGFWMMNFMHVLKNETTNEQHKNSDLKEMVDEREAFEKKQKLEKEKEKEEKDKKQQELEKLLEDEEKQEEDNKTNNNNNNKGRITINRSILAENRKFYRGGSYWGNIVEAFFPSSKPSSSLAVGKAFSSTSSENQKSGQNNNKNVVTKQNKNESKKKR